LIHFLAWGKEMEDGGCISGGVLKNASTSNNKSISYNWNQYSAIKKPQQVMPKHVHQSI
jgi:hypothetical protein